MNSLKPYILSVK